MPTYLTITYEVPPESETDAKEAIAESDVQAVLDIVEIDTPIDMEISPPD